MLTCRPPHIGLTVTFCTLLVMSGCVTAPLPSPPDTQCTADVHQTVDSVPVPSTSIKAPSMTIASETRLTTCKRDGSCDRIHFLHALFALQSNPEVAANHFREVVRLAPKSHVANLSRSWLKTMSTLPESEKSQAATETSAWLAELLNRDKKVEDLSKQLNALKLVDLEMKDRAPHIKPQMPAPSQTEQGR